MSDRPGEEMSGDNGPTDASTVSAGIRKGMTHRTLTGLFWTFMGTAVRGLVQLVTLAVLARALTVAEFGVITAGSAVIGFLAYLSSFGIGAAIVQLGNLQPRHTRTAFTAALALSAATTLLVWVISPAIAVFFRTNALVPVLRALSLVCVVRGAGVVAEGLLLRQMRFRLLAGIDVFTYALGYGVIGIGLALRSYGVWAFVGAYLAQAIVRLGMLLAVGRHSMILLVERRALADLLRFGIGLSLGKAVNNVATGGDSLVVGRWLGPETLGLYGRAYQLMAMPAMFIGEVLDTVLFPGMARLQDQQALLAAAYRRAVALIALLVLPISAVMFILAPEVVLVLLGRKWAAVVLPFQIFAVGMLFRTGYKIGDATVRAAGAVYRRAWRQAVYAALVLVGAWAGQVWGISGVAAAVVGAIAINYLLSAQLSLALTRLPWSAFWKAHLPGLKLASGVGVETWVLAASARAAGMRPVATLALVAVTMLLTLLLLRRWALAALGQDGHWMMKTLSGYLPDGRWTARWRHDLSQLDGVRTERGSWDGTLIVEFAGLPGVGKSTLASRVAHLLREAGVPVEEPRRKFAQQRFERIRKMIFVIREVLSRSGYAARSASAIVASRQQSGYEVVRELHNWLFVSSCLYRRRGTRGVRVLDQGVFQALWGIGYGAEEGAMEAVLRKLSGAMPKADLVVLLEANLATVKRRLAMRPHKHSRLDRLSHDQHHLFAKATRSLAEVKGAITCASPRFGSVACIVVDNNLDGNWEENASRLAARILSLYATRQSVQPTGPDVELPRYVGARG